MYDFQVLVTAYKQSHGVQDTDLTTAEDLDDLYAGLGDSIKDNPEAWN